MIDRYPPVAVACLDRPRSLQYSVNAAAQIMEATGENPIKWTVDDWKSLATDALLEAKPKRLVAVVHAMLVHEDPQLTRDRVAQMIVCLDQMKELFAAVCQAYANFIGPLKKDALATAAPAASADPTQA